MRIRSIVTSVAELAGLALIAVGALLLAGVPLLLVALGLELLIVSWAVSR